MGGIWEGFGRDWEAFERSGGAVGALGALCWVSRVFFSIVCIFTLRGVGRDWETFLGGV